MPLNKETKPNFKCFILNMIVKDIDTTGYKAHKK